MALSATLYAQRFDLEKFFSKDLQGLSVEERFEQLLIQANANYDVDMNASLVLIDSLRACAGRMDLTRDQQLKYDLVLSDVLTASGALETAKEHISRLHGRINTLNPEAIDKLAEMDIYESLANYAFAYSQLDSALYYSDRHLSLSLSQGDSLKAMNAFNSVGLIYETMGIYDLAAENLIQSAQVAEQLGLTKSIISIYNNLGLVYQENGDYDTGRAYLAKAVALIEEIGWESENGYAYGNLAYNRFYVGDFNTALDYAKRSEAAFVKYGFETELGLLNSLIGRIYVKLGEVNLGDEYLNKALAIATPAEFAEAYVEVLFGKAEVARARGLDLQEEKKLLEAVQVAYDHDLNKLRLTALEFLVSHYDGTKAYDKAFQAQMALSNLRDSIFNERKNYQIADLRTRYETTKKDEAILQGSLELEKQKARTNTIIIALVLAALLILFMSYFYLQIRKARNQLKEKNEIILDQNAELDALNSTKDKFFSIIAHDLRSPMIGLQEVGQKLEYFIRKNRQEKLLEIGGQIDKSIDQLNHLLNNLLNWAASQTGGVPYHPEKFDVKQLIDENVKLYQALAESKEVEILNHAAPMELFIDSNTAATVIRNLLSNAIKFSPPGSRIRIITEAFEKYGTILISDEGPGMDDETLAALFGEKPPSQTGSQGERGFGLGLKLCKEFVEMNRGSIEVESFKGKGTSFTITFPREAKGVVRKFEVA